MRITRYVAAHDSGTIFNRLTAESQIKGGVMQGIGMAFTEELLIDQLTATPINPDYRDAKVPTHLEAPEVEVIFIEHAIPMGLLVGSGGRAADHRRRGDHRERDLQRHGQAFQRASYYTRQDLASDPGLMRRRP